jgi:hypothetical protein
MPRPRDGAAPRCRVGALLHLPLSILLLCAASLNAETAIVFGIYSVATDGDVITGRVKNRRGNEVNLGEDSGIGISDVRDVRLSHEFGEDNITIEYTDSGAVKNSAFTTKHAKRRIAFVFKGESFAEPLIYAASKEETLVSSGAGQGEMKRIVTELKALIARNANP